MLAALLAEAQPVALEDGRLVLAYPASAAFSKRKVEDAAPTSERVAEALRLVTGRAARGPLRAERRATEPVGSEPESVTERGRGDRAVQGRVRRRGRRSRTQHDVPKLTERSLMPQPNLNKMMKQVQEMQAEMMKAQEQLKDEIVEASAGGGMVTVKITGDLELKEIKIDPERARRGRAAPEDVEMLQDMVLAAVNEAIRSAQELAAQPASCGGLDRRPRRSRPARRSRLRVQRAMFSPPVNRLITELVEAARHRPAHRAAARVPPPARARARRRSASPRRSGR